MVQEVLDTISKGETATKEEVAERLKVSSDMIISGLKNLQRPRFFQPMAGDCTCCTNCRHCKKECTNAPLQGSGEEGIR